MKKIIIILTICAILGGCNFCPDKRSNLTITSKELSTFPDLGKFKYNIHTTYSIQENFDYWSDSSYEVGETLKITKQ